jgi:hypothetical protein
MRTVWVLIKFANQRMELTNISQKEIAAQKAKGKRHLSCELSKGNHKSPRFLGAEYGTVPTDMDLS